MENKDIEKVQQKINYTFQNPDLIYQAFTRASFSQENGGESNENLELIGDSILYYYVTKYLADRYGYLAEKSYRGLDEWRVRNDFTEKELTDIRKSLIERSYLAARVEAMNIKHLMYLGNGARQNHEENLEKAKADLFEAILGAVAIDCDWNTEILADTTAYMLHIDNYFAKYIYTDDNYIMLLQQWHQKRHGTLPSYEIAQNYDGTPTAFLTIKTSHGNQTFQGEGKNRTIAKTAAAKDAYEFLEENGDLFSIQDEITEKITLENAIGTLQELSQKGYFSAPAYTFSESGDDRYPWECVCEIESASVRKDAFGTSKKIAKKYAAYLAMCDIFGWEDEYKK